MKIVFMGTPGSAAVSLERLINDAHEIDAVYTQPDRPSGRHNKIVFSPVKELAMRQGIPLFQPAKIKTRDALDKFRSHNADVAVVVAYGRILPEGFLNSFRYGALNVHFSLLPKYRGAAPVNWAIVNGETETGVTVIQMDVGLDTGNILLQESTPIGCDETSIELTERLAIMGAELISRALGEIDTLTPRSQNESEASLAPILNKEDGLIDWSMTAVEIECRVRGFQPFPTAFTFHKNSRLTIWKATVLKEVASETPAGTITEADGDRLIISCGNGSSLAVEEIQMEGKRRMSARDFLNGSKLRRGQRFGEQERSTTAYQQSSKTE